MDIYRFLDSNDIRAHLQSLRYGFTLPEAARFLSGSARLRRFRKSTLHGGS